MGHSPGLFNGAGKQRWSLKTARVGKAPSLRVMGDFKVISSYSSGETCARKRDWERGDGCVWIEESAKEGFPSRIVLCPSHCCSLETSKACIAWRKETSTGPQGNRGLDADQNVTSKCTPFLEICSMQNKILAPRECSISDIGYYTLSQVLQRSACPSPCDLFQTS
jgi:hypothetical protein